MSGINGSLQASSIDFNVHWLEYLSQLAKMGGWKVSHSTFRGWAWVQCNGIRVDLLHLDAILEEPTLGAHALSLPAVIVINPLTTPTTFVRDAITIGLARAHLSVVGRALSICALHDQLVQDISTLSLDHLRLLLDAHPRPLEKSVDGLYLYQETQQTNLEAPVVDIASLPWVEASTAIVEQPETATESDSLELTPLPPQVNDSGPGFVECGHDPPLEKEEERSEPLLLALVSLLFEMARADHRVLAQEIATIGKFFKEDLGLDEATTESVLLHAGDESRRPSMSEAADVLRDLPMIVRQVLLKSAVEVAYADNHYDPLEKGVLRGLGQQLGIDEAYVDHLERGFHPGASERGRSRAALCAEENFSNKHLNVILDYSLRLVESARQHPSAWLFDTLLMRNVDQLKQNFKRAVAAEDGPPRDPLAALPDTSGDADYPGLREAASGYREQHQSLSYADGVDSATSQSVQDHGGVARALKSTLESVLACDRTRRIIEEAGFRTVQDLLKVPPSVIRDLPGLGSTSWSKLRLSIESHARRHPLLSQAVNEYFRNGKPVGQLEPQGPKSRTLELLRLSDATERFLRDRGISNIEQLLASEHTTLFGSVAEEESCWPAIKKALLRELTAPGDHQRVLSFISKADAISERAVPELLDSLLLEHGTCPSWKLQQLLLEQGVSKTDAEVRQGLWDGVDEGRLFRLSAERYALAEKLELPADQTSRLRELAIRYLQDHHDLRCFEPSWREELNHLDGDVVDYGLSGCLSLSRISPGVYKLSSVPKVASNIQPAAESPTDTNETENATAIGGTSVEANLMEILFGNLQQSNEPLAFWKIRDVINMQRPSWKDDELQEALDQAVAEGRLFELAGNRYGLPDRLWSDPQQLVALEEAALCHLEAHAQLSVFDTAWRADYRALSADLVDHALHHSGSLMRSSPGIYSLRPPEESRPEGLAVLEQAPEITFDGEISHLAQGVAITIVEQVEKRGKPLNIESFGLDSTGVSMREIILALRAHPRVQLYSFTRLWVSLAEWGEGGRQSALEQAWPVYRGDLKKHFEHLRPEQFSESDWKTAEALLIQDQDADNILHFRAKLSAEATELPIGRVLDHLASRGKPTRLAHLMNTLDIAKRYQGDVLDLLSADQRFIIYPFGSKDWIGLPRFGQEDAVGVIREAWPWVKVTLEELKSGREEPGFSPEHWAALRVVARETGRLDLIPDEFQDDSWQPERVAGPADITLLETATATSYPTPGDTPTKLLAGLLKRARQLAKPYSIAEIEVTRDEFAELEAWFAGLNKGTLYQWFASQKALGGDVTGWTRHEGFGFLSLVFIAETVRRQGQEGSLWPFVAPKFGEAARHELFVGHHPRADMSRCLEAAVRLAGVRQAYARAGNQGAYVTIYLQFGFTARGIGRLPRWLSEGVPTSQAIEILSADTKGAFARLWQHLKAYRRGNVSRSEMRAHLEGSSWILGDWVENILEAAKAAQVTQPSALGPAISPPADGASIDQPRLTWNPPSLPCLSYNLTSLVVDLSQSGYDLLVDEELLGRVTRRVDGRYAFEPEILSLDLQREFSSIVLVGDDDDEEMQFTLPHFPEHENQLAIDLTTGLPTSLANAKREPLALLLHIDDEAEPGASRYELPSLSRALVYIPPGATSASTTSRVENYAFSWRSRVKLACYENSIPIGGRFEVSAIGLPRETTLLWARAAGHDLEVRSEFNQHTISGKVDPAFAKPSLAIEFAVDEAGQVSRVERSVKLPVFGVTMLENGVWVRGSGLQELSVREARERPFRFLLGAGAPEDYALVEGDVFATRPSALPTTLSGLEGYGAPLYLRIGPYNSTSDGYLVAQTVVNNGLLRSFQRGTNKLHIALGRKVSPSVHHKVWLWEPGRTPVSIGSEGIVEPQPGLWSVTTPGTFQADNFAVGISFNGERLGAAWVPDFEVPSSTGNPHTTAGLMRWFQLPLLAPHVQPSVASFVAAHCEATFNAWVEARDITDLGLVHAAEERGWFSVVRKYFRPLGKELILRAWQTIRRTRDISQAFELMTDVDPVLAGCMVIYEEKEMTAQIARNGILRLPGMASESEAIKALQEMLRQAAKEMSSDTRFVERTCQAICAFLLSKTPIDDHVRRNLTIACNVDPFRRYLAGLLLQTWLEAKCRD